MKSNSLAWHYSLKRRLTFDPFSLKGQCFTTYSVLSFILLPKYTIPPFAQLQACIFIFGFLKMTKRPEVIAFMINSGCSFWLSEKLPKGKGPFPVSVYSTWVFFPFFSDMKKKKTQGSLRFKHCYLPSNLVSQWWESDTHPIPETCVSVSFGGKYWVTRDGIWVTHALIDACSENSVGLIFKQRYLTYVEAGGNCPD